MEIVVLLEVSLARILFFWGTRLGRHRENKRTEVNRTRNVENHSEKHTEEMRTTISLKFTIIPTSI